MFKYKTSNPICMHVNFNKNQTNLKSDWKFLYLSFAFILFGLLCVFFHSLVRLNVKWRNFPSADLWVSIILQFNEREKCLFVLKLQLGLLIKNNWLTELQGLIIIGAHACFLIFWGPKNLSSVLYQTLWKYIKFYL